MKVTLYIDGEHNTVEVKDKIKSVLPDANYMIFDHAKSKGKVTNYERIKNMSVEEMSNFLMDWFIDGMVGKAPMNVKAWLETEVEE